MTTPEFERTLYIRDYQHAQMAAALQKGVTVVAIGVLGIASHLTALGPIWLASTAALAASILANEAGKVRKATHARAQDVEDMSDIMFTQQMYTEQMAPIEPSEKLKYASVLKAKEIAAGASKALPAAPQKLFKPNMFEDITDLLERKRDGTAKYPHFAIMGGTGDGKTLIAEYLADVERIKWGVRTIYVSPTVDQDEETGAWEFLGSEMVGCGWTLDPVRGEAIPTSNRFADIGAFVSELSEEAGLRYALPPSEVTAMGPISVYFDETLTSMKDVTCVGYNGETMSVGHGVMHVAAVARKKSIRVVQMLIVNSVAALDIKGLGDTRRNFTALRLGSYAKDHFNTLYVTGETEAQARVWWAQMEHEYGVHSMAMVEDQVCILPDLSKYRESKAELEYRLLMGPSLSVQPLPAVAKSRAQRQEPARPPRVAKPPEYSEAIDVQSLPVDDHPPSIPSASANTFRGDEVADQTNLDIKITNAHGGKYKHLPSVKETSQARVMLELVYGTDWKKDGYHLYDLFDYMRQDKKMTGPKIKRMLGYDDTIGKAMWEDYEYRTSTTGDAELESQTDTTEGH